MELISSEFNSDNLIEITNLTVIRSDFPVFSPVNFSLGAGQAMQIRGTNGAGKTTLLRAICGLCHSLEGEISWNDEVITPAHQNFYQSLLYIGHALGLKPKLTIEQNLSFFQQLRFELDSQLIQEAMQAFGIAELYDEYVAKLSAGQKRRVSLCRIITEPVPLWILDEPLVALDVDGQQWMLDICNQHLERGGILLITSHQPINGIHNLRELTLS